MSEDCQKDFSIQGQTRISLNIFEGPLSYGGIRFDTQRKSYALFCSSTSNKKNDKWLYCVKRTAIWPSLSFREAIVSSSESSGKWSSWSLSHLGKKRSQLSFDKTRIGASTSSDPHGSNCVVCKRPKCVLMRSYSLILYRIDPIPWLRRHPLKSAISRKDVNHTP